MKLCELLVLCVQFSVQEELVIFGADRQILGEMSGTRIGILRSCVNEPVSLAGPFAFQNSLLIKHAQFQFAENK